MKLVVIVSLVIFTSSCTWYGATTRDIDRCIYSTADPNSGTVEQAVRANAENYFVNKPHCNDQFNQLGIKK